MTETKILTETAPSLEETQSFVGGYVEMYNLGKEQILFNEEGLLLGLPLNEEASTRATFPVYGNAIFLSGPARWK